MSMGLLFVLLLLRNFKFLGTDEYGTTTETRALLERCTPQQLCDKYHEIHAEVYKWFNISFDIFGRTTTRLQTEIAQDIFLKLDQNGFLVERLTTQLYCQQHNAFLADRFVEGQCPLCNCEGARGDQCDYCGQLLDPLDLIRPRCKIDGATPTTKQTKHIFLELDKLQPEIENFFKASSANGAWSMNGKDITSAWLKDGLKPRSITRDLRWGTEVPLPGYETKVIYPWFDACIGYASITANYTEQWQKWWRNPNEVQLYQFIGKDNVPYHSVLFPSSQIGTRDIWTKLHHLSTLHLDRGLVLGIRVSTLKFRGAHSKGQAIANRTHRLSCVYLVLCVRNNGSKLSTLCPPRGH